MGKADAQMRNFWGKNEYFADLFNAALFDGESVLKPEDLTAEDSDLSFNLESGKKKKYIDTLGYVGDVVKKQAYGTEFLIFSIQNQMKTDYSMPVREMMNHALIYMRECKMISDHNLASGEKLTYEERFSMRKTDRIHGVVALTIYYGEHPWDGPKCLHDMLAEMPEKMRGVVADYPLNLVEVVSSETLKFSNPDVAQVFRLSRAIYHKQIDKEEFRNVRVDLAEMVGYMVKSKQIVTIARKSAGKEIDMCEALEEMMQEREDKGREIGKEIGKEIGEKRGMKIGQWKVLVEQTVQKIRKNRTVEQTAEMLETDPAVVWKIYDAAQRFAPEYNVDQIVGYLMQN